MDFELLYTDKASQARAGVIRTDHSEIQTPVFMPVGTAGSVKGIRNVVARSFLRLLTPPSV